MENDNAIRMGIDPGYGNFKGACAPTDDSGSVQVAVVPSVVGIGDTDLGMLHLGKLRRHRKRAIPDKVTFGGATYLVGEGVAQYARPVQRMDFERLSGGPEMRALFYDTIARLLGTGDTPIPLRLMFGLPVEVMVDTNLARETLRGLKGWVVGEHEFTVNDERVSFTVEGVQAMAQPAGAFFAWGLDNGGVWARSKNDLKAPVAVCDIGFNTLDLFAVQGGQVMKRFTGGDTAGMRRAAELLISSVRALGISLSLHEADAYLRQSRPRMWTSDGEIDLRPQVDQALASASAGIITFVERQWEKGKQFGYVLFVGGGAEALRKQLLAQYPHGIILPDAVSTNAVGLARYANRVFNK